MNHYQLQRLAISPTQIQEDRVCLTPQQQHYLGRVLPLQTGDRFIAINGQETWWLCELLAAATAKIIESIPVQTELPVAVTMMVALPKGNGFDDGCALLYGVGSQFHYPSGERSHFTQTQSPKALPLAAPCC